MSNPIMSGFTSIGEIFASKAAPYIQSFQNSFMPSTKPQNTNGNSFDFLGAFNQAKDVLLAGATGFGASIGTQAKETIFKPATPQTSQDYLKDIFNFAYSGAKTLGNAYISNYADSILNGNKKPVETVSVGASSENPAPSQNSGFSLQDILGAISGAASGKQSPAVTYVAEEASKTAMNSVFLVGGAALLLILVLNTGRK